MLAQVFARRGRSLPAMPINRRKMIRGWCFYAFALTAFVVSVKSSTCCYAFGQSIQLFVGGPTS
jgi:hypothetical protein